MMDLVAQWLVQIPREPYDGQDRMAQVKGREDERTWDAMLQR